MLEDEQAHANNYFTRVEVPGVGETTTVDTVVTLSETPGSPKGNAPELGEANTELLGNAGLSTEEIEEIEATATKVREETLLELQKVAAAAANYQAE